MSNQLGVMSIPEISGIFEIPSYQRGYRWGKDETDKLLNDLMEFETKGFGHYCLQPIVVKRLGENRFELIDGQQRLTTLYLILKVLKEKAPYLEIRYEIDYKIRERCTDFLKTISPDSDESNIDFYHIKKAYLAIKEWFDKNIGNQARKILEVASLLESKVDIIWYEVDSREDGAQLFQNLNIGKIPLTSSELVKAMFLSNSSGKAFSEEKKDQIAFQWDNMEKELHDESFWCFLTKEDYQPRIDLVLNLDSGCLPNSKEKYATFYYYDDKRRSGADLDEVWNGIQHTFLIIKSWYKRHELYHLIGFLTKIGVPLRDIFAASTTRSKEDFVSWLTESIRSNIANKNKNYGELSYEKPDEKKKISNLLLLFNVISTMKHGANSEWFAFDKFKEGQWSLEHIHAQQSLGMEKEPEWKEWLKLHLDSVSELSDDQELLAQMRHYSQDSVSLTREVFESIRIRAENVLSANTYFGSLHTISNLALLRTDNNAALSNSTFDVKRKKIIEFDKDGQFIPYCTKMVFLKYYSKSRDSQIHFWGTHDRQDYLDSINEVLAEYLGEEKVAETLEESEGGSEQ